VFNHDYQVNDSFGSFTERIAPGAFTRTLSENPDVTMLLNHEGLPLARTKAGTMTLTQDNIGLKVSAQLDQTDPDVQRILPKMRRGDLDEMSMAFRVNGQEWDQNFTDRTINEINLARGDVSIVTFGANPATVAALRAALADDEVRRALFEERETGTEDAPCAQVETESEITEETAEEPAQSDENERSSTLSYLSKLLDARKLA